MNTLEITAACMQEKLIELMGREEYGKWSVEVAKRVFAAEIDQMEDCNFKEFCKEHFDEITEV